MTITTPAGYDKCGPTKDYFDDAPTIQLVGRRVERIIETDFENSPAGFPSLGNTFFDRGSDPDEESDPEPLIQFLRSRPFGGRLLSDADVERMRAGYAVRDTYSVLDIVAYVPGSTGEFYEIKPNSDAGKKVGRQKIKRFTRLTSEFRLDYYAGSKYAPIGLQRFESRLFKGIWIWEIDLHFWRADDALILYEFCHNGRLRKVELPDPSPQLFLALAALLILLILTDGAAAPIMVTA
jgi:hypothetical protein